MTEVLSNTTAVPSRGGPNVYLKQISDQLAELREAQKQQAIERARIRERITGIKHVMVFTGVISPAATTFLFPAILRPDTGWAWNLKLCLCKLSANDSVAVYRSESANGPLIGYAGPPGAAPGQFIAEVTWSSDQMILPPNEPLFFATSGTGNFVSVTVAAIQIPAERIGEILG